jgi:hypothetical protein
MERWSSAFARIAHRAYARACDDKIGSLLVAHAIYQPSALQGTLHVGASHLRYVFILERAISALGGENRAHDGDLFRNSCYEGVNPRRARLS